MDSKNDAITFFFETVKNRRSVRKYTPTPVPQEHITQILEAAAYAPTAGNRQPWRFLVIQEPETIRAIKQAAIELSVLTYMVENEHTPEELAKHREKKNRLFADLYSAPLYIIIFTDSYEQYSHYNADDGPLAAAHICLAARALGYGSLYATESISDAAVRKVIPAPVKYTFVCGIAIGVPTKWPRMPAKKPLTELVVYENFQHPTKENGQKG